MKSPNKCQHETIGIKNYLQAESRIHILEQAVSEAQSSESQVTELQDWICRVDDLLNDFIEHDTTFECLPHDFQVNFNVYIYIFISLTSLHTTHIKYIFLFFFSTSLHVICFSFLSHSF